MHCMENIRNGFRAQGAASVMNAISAYTCIKAMVWYTIGPTALCVKCPISSLLGECPGGYWNWLCYSGYHVGVHRLFPLTFHISVFSIHSSSPVTAFHSCFFFTTDVSVPIRSTLHLLTF